MKLDHWIDEGENTLIITVEDYSRVYPYVRQTRRGRFGADPKHRKAIREYNDYINGLRDEAILLMRGAGLGPMGKRAIWLEVTIALSRALWRADLSNYVKSLEDAFNNALWIDDRWITKTSAQKMLTDRDWFFLRAEQVL